MRRVVEVKWYLTADDYGLIKRQFKEKKIKVGAFAKKIGLSRNGLHLIFKGKTPMTTKMIKALQELDIYLLVDMVEVEKWN